MFHSKSLSVTVVLVSLRLVPNQSVRSSRPQCRQAWSGFCLISWSSLLAVLPGWMTCCCRRRHFVRSPFLFGLVILDINRDSRVDQHRTLRSICI
jgi:hypothetical protein